MNDPVLILLTAAAGLYGAWLWWGDLQAARAGRPLPQALPGAVPAPLRACVVAAIGALVITAAETGGELGLGLSGQQSKMTVLFGAYSLVAAFIEELVFRGFVVIDGRGATWRWLGAVGASVLFAALHPFLWSYESAGAGWWEFWRWTWSLHLDAKGWFSTGAVFVSSLWFYAMRFAARLNPQRSLLPCVTAHATKNLAVFAIKAAQGFVSGWW